MRPRCSIAHVGPMYVSSVRKAATFYADLGMRTVMVTDGMAILELSGGTHLLLRRGPATSGPAPFDLMVDDIDEIRRELLSTGVPLGPVRRGSVHQTFELVDPDGHRVSITSSHAMGPV